MERTYIKDLEKKVGESVSISGWVDTRRDHGKLIFIDFRDMSGKVQAVALPTYSEAHEVASKLRSEWVVEVSGKINKRPEKMIKQGVLNGDVELEIENIKVLSEAGELPFEKDTDLNLDTYLDYLPFTLRTDRAKNIFKVQAAIIEEFREALKEKNFTEFQSPSLVGGDAEGGAAAFTVDYYYDQKAYLATSPQFYKQIMVGVFERVFSTPKIFRGEKHSTARHLSEYSSLDFEMGFIKDHTDVMAMLENVIRQIVKRMEVDCADSFSVLNSPLPLISEKIPVFKLKDVQEIIEKEFGGKALGEPDLEPEHERQISEWVKKEHNSDFVFVTHYPVSKRPFYTYEDEADPGFTKSFDLIFRGLEITTGGQRIHSYDLLVEKLKSKGLNPEQFSYYLQAFKYGMPPHGGSATGLERITARMLNLANVKEAALFPRDLNRIDTLLSTDKKKNEN